MDFAEDSIISNIIFRFIEEGRHEVDAAAADIAGIGTAAQTAQPGLTQFADKVSTVGLALAGIGAVGAAASLKLFSDWQENLSKLQGLYGLTEDQSRQLGDAVMKVSEETGVSAAALGEQLVTLYADGYRGSQAIDLLALSARASIGAHTDQATVIQSVNSELKIYHEAASQADTVTNTILAGVKESGKSWQELSTQLSRVSPVAEQLGVSLASLVGAESTLDQQGVALRVSASGLTQIFQDLRDPTTALQTAASGLGFQWQQLYAVHGGNLLATLQRIDQAAKSGAQSHQEYTQRLKELLGSQQAVTAFLALSADNWSLLKKHIDDATNSAGTVNQAYGAATKDIAFQFSKLETNVKDVLIGIGAGLAPLAEDAAKAIEPLLVDFEKFDAEHPSWVGAATAIGLSLGGLAVAIKAGEIGYGLYASAAAAARAGMGLLATTAPEADAGIASTGVAAATATPEILAYDASLGATAGLSSGLIVSSGGVTTALAATGAEAGVAAGGMGILGGSLDVLMGPVGIAALGVALGVLAYKDSPDFRAEVDKLAGSLEPKLVGAFRAAGDAAGWFGDQLKKAQADGVGTGSQIDQNISKLDAEYKAHHQAAKGADEHKQKGLDLLQVLGASVPVLSTVGSWLDHEGASHRAAADAAHQHALSIADLGEKMRQARLAGDVGGGSETGLSNSGISSGTYSPSDLSQQFASDSKAASAALTTDLQAMAESILKTGTVLDSLTRSAARDQETVDRHADALTEAGVRVALSSGDASKAVESFAGSLQSKATGQVDLLAIALQRGASNVGLLETKAIAAQKGLDEYTKFHTQAAKMVAAAAGDEVNAHGKITSAATTAALALVDLGTRLSTATSKSQETLTAGIYTGDSPEKIQRLADAAARAADHSKHWTDATDQSILMIARRTGDYSQVLADAQRKLQDALNSAEGKLVLDRRSGAGPSVLAADQARVTEAGAALDRFQKQLDSAKQSAQAVDHSFSGLEQKAQTLATNDLGKLAEAIRTGASGIKQSHLEENAVAAAQKLAGFQTALDAATIRVEEKSGQFGAAASGEQAKLQNDVNNALGHAALDIQKHGAASDADRLAIERTSAALAGFANDEKAAAAVATASLHDFASSLTAATGKVAADLDALEGLLASHEPEAGRRIGPEIEKLVQDYKDQEKLDKIVQKAQYDAAVATGDWTTVVRISTDTVGNKLAEAQNKYVYDLEHHTGDLAKDRAAIEDDTEKVRAHAQAIAQATVTVEQQRQAWDSFIAAMNGVTVAQQKVAGDQSSGIVAGIDDVTAAIKDQTGIMQAESGLRTSENDAIVSAINDQVAEMQAADAVAADQVAAQTQAITSATSILQAQSAVASAAGQGQVSAITDQTAIMKDGWDIAHASDAASRQIAELQLQVDRDKAAADAAKASEDVQIARLQLAAAHDAATAARTADSDKIAIARAQLTETHDKAVADARISADALAVERENVKIAIDTAAVDAANATAEQKVRADQLKVDEQGVKLAFDNLALAALQVHLLGSIDAGVNNKSETPTDQALGKIQDQINSDNSIMTGLQGQLQQDQGRAAQVQASGQQTIAIDQQQLEALKEIQLTDQQAESQQLAFDNSNIAALQAQLAKDQGAGSQAAAQDANAIAAAQATAQSDQFSWQRKIAQDTQNLQMAQLSAQQQGNQLAAAQVGQLQEQIEILSQMLGLYGSTRDMGGYYSHGNSRGNTTDYLDTRGVA